MKIDANILLTAKILNGEGGGPEPTGTVEITTNGTHDVAQYAEAHVAVPADGLEKLMGLLTGADTEFSLSGLTMLRASAFRQSNYVRISLPDVKVVGTNAFEMCATLEEVSLPSVDTLAGNCFTNCYALRSLDLGDSLRQIQASTFGNGFAKNAATPMTLSFPASLQTVAATAVAASANVSEIRFHGKPTTLNANAFGRNTKISNVYVPWSEGEVAGAPWGATNATVHYNTTYDANGDPVV